MAKITGFKCHECDRNVLECNEQIFCEIAMEEHDAKIRKDAFNELLRSKDFNDRLKIIDMEAYISVEDLTKWLEEKKNEQNGN